jgi:hypothetical protein
LAHWPCGKVCCFSIGCNVHSSCQSVDPLTRNPCGGRSTRPAICGFVHPSARVQFTRADTRVQVDVLTCQAGTSRHVKHPSNADTRLEGSRPRHRPPIPNTGAEKSAVLDSALFSSAGPPCACGSTQTLGTLTRALVPCLEASFHPGSASPT